MNADRLLTAAEVGAYLGVKESWIRARTRAGDSTDGESYRYSPTERERYVFLVHGEGELVGSAIVEVHPPNILGRVRSATKAAGIDIPLIGPCLYEEGNEVAIAAGVFVEPEQPLAVLFGLMDGFRQVGLPTYAHPVNRRTELLARRYLVA